MTNDACINTTDLSQLLRPVRPMGVAPQPPGAPDPLAGWEDDGGAIEGLVSLLA